MEALGIDLTFQGIAQELATFPGEYQPPRGRLLLAMRATSAVGCAAGRPLSDTNGELKRLYVRPAARALYTSLGFRVIPAYRDNPIAGAQFMECLL